MLNAFKFVKKKDIKKSLLLEMTSYITFLISKTLLKN